MKIITKETVERLCIFLKLLSEQSTKPTAINLTKMAEYYEIPYRNNIINVMTKKGILLRSSNTGRKNTETHFLYKWNSDTEPNMKMAEAILKECYFTCNKHKKGEEQIQNYTIPQPSSKIMHITCKSTEEACKIVHILHAVYFAENPDEANIIDTYCKRMDNHLLLSPIAINLLHSAKDLLNNFNFTT